MCAGGAAGFGGGVLAAAGALAAAPLPSAMTATTAPTGAISPSGTRISLSTPVVVDGTSIETLSVSISNRLSPGLTGSPADLNHLVIFPSATVSPSCGIRTSISLDPLPYHFRRRADRTQDQTVADEFVAAHNVALVARLYAAQAMMRDGARLFVDRISPEIGDVLGKCGLRLPTGRFFAGARDFAVRRDVAGHMAMRVVDDDALGIAAAFCAGLAFHSRTHVAPRTD